ncbi:iron-sulfur cluster assembly protein [Saccharopolyspora rhizosphaerae]|uniref:Iron-sulfur cluster assembly protein n=1 Tax=Saccharopolyspora rhizosphaerae TaxID=2492662 RepID=A0A426K4K3_9PSEU|nr:iron-sulfur cluster assembly protein [Saccharopolyspora rhizosphaerae]RRO20354.1 iron-sulfur cluster assembly protein [Saccharopolyspora rhizosphaerae]
MTAPSTVDVNAVERALGQVVDPELDRPITELGFVARCEVDADRVEVDLRLPTYFCAPNFAYLMVSDAHDALTALRGVGSVVVRLLDHFASEEINAGVAAGEGFDAAFPGLSAGELDDLRAVFLRKAHAAEQERLAAALLKTGRTHGELTALTLDDVPDTAALRRHRRRLGFRHDGAAPLLLDDTGEPLTPEDLPARLRIARTTRYSIEANASWCQGLLTTRYPEP